MFGVVDRLVLERVVVPNRQVRDRDEDGVEDEGRERVAEHLGRLRAQDLGHRDVRRARRGPPGQLQRRGDGEERRRHHDEQQVLHHVVPEELAVVDPDEAEDGDAGGDQGADPGRRLEGRPRVAGMQGVVPPDRPQVEDQGHDDHGHRHEGELAGEELVPAQGGQGRVVERSEHSDDGTARVSRAAKRAGRSLVVP